MLKILILTILLLFYLPAHSQNQERILMAYNLSFGAITTTVGALINKPKGEKLHKTILKSFCIGSAGGALLYLSKDINYYVHKRENYYYGWPSVLLHNAGTSLMENAALNRKFLRNWHLDIGILRVNFGKNTPQGLNFRLYPIGIYSVGAGYALGGKIDWKASLQSGFLTFKSERKVISVLSAENAAGIALGHTYIYTQDLNKYYVAAHEHVHILQYREYQIFNTWAYPITEKFRNTRTEKVFKKYLSFELPYLLPFYFLEGIQGTNCYYNNFFEFEAERFSTRSNLNICK